MSSRPTKYGFSLVVRGADATPETFAAMAERSEALGLDSLWLSAHVIVPPQGTSDYAMVPGRKYPPHWLEAYWEPFTVLGYLAARTERLLLGTSVVVLPMHNPFEVAKQVAEIDRLCGGRFIFGIGVGWFENEFKVLGQNFKNRGARTDDALALMRALWGPDPVSYQGRYYQVEGAHFSPKPVQQPRPPIWIAGGPGPGMRRAAQSGDMYHPVNPSYDFMGECRAELDRLLDAEGRPRDSVGIAAKLPIVFKSEAPGEGVARTIGRNQDIVDALRRYRELGSEHFVLDLQPETLANALDTMERFAQEIRPKLD